ncbi:MAG: fatty acyl-AMP ligase [Gemmatimonadaceae bacterium]|nr:fatty acyl-AMP ligase [Gemmatimonadaceae bacterium]
MTPTFDTLIALLEHRAAEQGSERAYTFLLDGDLEGGSFEYGGLTTKAKAIATMLAERGVMPGDRALLLYSPGVEFIAAFFGCLCAGVIAVPAYPPHTVQLARTLPRLVAVTTDAQVSIVLTTDTIAQMAAELAMVAPSFRDLPWLATDRVASDAADAWRRPSVSADSLALLQYTSGSTSAPKGVMVSHGNLLHNLAYLDHLEENDATSVAVSWLPVIHDMGLIEAVLLPAYAGYPAYLMAPETFLQRPLRWLQAITRYRGTNSGGPNFAFDLCTRKVTSQQVQTLDLSSWRCAYNGAEPIRRDTLVRFHETFRGAGFRWKSFFPVYGLAESTLLVSSSRRIDEPVSCDADADALTQGRFITAIADASRRTTSLVACGPVWFGTEIRIIDPETHEQCAPNRVGEIWISSLSVARGYWRRPEQTALAFGARLSTGEGTFLRTGDLGVMHEGQLVVTGRLKDLLIVRGAKHYPQDFELTAERQHAAVRAGCCAAFVVGGSDGESVVLAAEIDIRQLAVPSDAERKTQLADIAAAIRRGIVELHGVQLQAVTLINPGSIPKTTSGKLQRQACRAAFEFNKLDELHRWTRTPAIAPSRERPEPHLAITSVP